MPRPRPRIAISQGPYLRELSDAKARVEQHMRAASARGMDMIIFPEWFLGLNPVEVLPNRHTEWLSGLAQELGLTVITGSLRILDAETGKKQQRGLVIDADGTLKGSQPKILFQPTERPWFEPGTNIIAVTTRWGRTSVMLGLDAEHPDLWRQVETLSPDLVVMAVAPHTLKERERLHEIALTRSASLLTTVCVAPLLGRFSGQNYVGGALVAHNGRVIASASDQEQVVISGDPEAPLIQLGVVDTTSVVPVATSSLEAVKNSRRALGSEAERRVLLDWDGLTHVDIRMIAQHLLQVAAENPRWVALAPARPRFARELQAFLEAGAAGAYLYPGLDEVFPYEPLVMELGRVLDRMHRPVLVHTGPGAAPLRYDRPILWDEFATKFPEAPLILAHLGTRPPFTDEALMLAERHPHVFLETSRAPVELVHEAIRTIGADRVLFGSGGLAQDFEAEWRKIAVLKEHISDEDFQAMTWKTARSLFYHDARGASDQNSHEGPRLAVVRPQG